MLNSIKLNTNVTILAERSDSAPLVEYTVITNDTNEKSAQVFSFTVSSRGLIVAVSPVEAL